MVCLSPNFIFLLLEQFIHLPANEGVVVWVCIGTGSNEAATPVSQKSKMPDEPFQEIKALGWPDPGLILS